MTTKKSPTLRSRITKANASHNEDRTDYNDLLRNLRGRSLRSPRLSIFRISRLAQPLTSFRPQIISILQRRTSPSSIMTAGHVIDRSTDLAGLPNSRQQEES